MKCKACNGTGVLVAPIYENDEIGFVDKTYQCYCCRGRGVIEQTNEEWFDNLSTEEKARFFSHEMRCEFCPNQEQCDSLGANCKVLWEQWLKQLHRGDANEM